MKIIAFDLGGTAAYAHNCGPGDEPYAGSRTFAGIREHRFLVWSEWLGQIFSMYRPEAVIYERPFSRGLAATRSGWGYAGILECEATRAGCAVLSMPPATIKKHATGHGFASKQMMMDAARKTGYTGSNEHEADAWCLLRYGETHMERGT